LKSVNLSHNNLCKNNASLQNGFRHIISEKFGLIQKHLETLLFVDIKLQREDDQKALCIALKRVTTMKELDISENKGVQLDELLLALNETGQIEKLHFAGNLGSRVPLPNSTRPSYKFLTKGIDLMQLSRLDLSGSLGKDGALAISKCSALRSLTWLNLSNCKLDKESLNAIVN